MREVQGLVIGGGLLDCGQEYAFMTGFSARVTDLRWRAFSPSLSSSNSYVSPKLIGYYIDQ